MSFERVLRVVAFVFRRKITFDDSNPRFIIVHIERK